MIYLDAYALIAFLVAEPAKAEVAALLRQEPAIGAVNLAESVDRCVRLYGIPEGELWSAVAQLQRSGVLRVPPAGLEVGWRAGALRAAHYRRRTSELSLADCFLLASATPGEDAIATSDPPVAAAARALGIELVALPDSDGRRPEPG
ncbi:MAG TPA: PIN domain-containing protein [Gaiellaceae bacterium]|nr:PIN domain-containing protein [Gaiellaceae bacterium]